MATKLITLFVELDQKSKLVTVQQIEGVLLDYEDSKFAKRRYECEMTLQTAITAGDPLKKVEYEIIDRFRDEISLHGFSITRKYIVEKVK